LILLPSDLEITEYDDTIGRYPEISHHNKEVVDEEDINPEVDMTLQPEGD
jgi:hypothetical protein